MSSAVCAYSFSSSCLSSALESIAFSQLAQKEATGNLISTLRTGTVINCFQFVAVVFSELVCFSTFTTLEVTADVQIA